MKLNLSSFKHSTSNLRQKLAKVLIPNLKVLVKSTIRWGANFSLSPHLNDCITGWSLIFMDAIYKSLEEVRCTWNTLYRLIRHNFGLIIIILLNGYYAWIGQNLLF